MDASGSVENSFALIQELAKRIVYGLDFSDGATRVGIVTYRNSEQIRFNLDEYTSRDEVVNAIAYDQDYSEGTFTSSAIKAMREDMFTTRNGDRRGVDDVAMVITDGRSNIQKADTIREADLAKDEGILMMSVGVGERVWINELTGMASEDSSGDSSDNVFLLLDSSELDDVADQILDALCER